MKLSTVQTSFSSMLCLQSKLSEESWPLYLLNAFPDSTFSFSSVHGGGNGHQTLVPPWQRTTVSSRMQIMRCWWVANQLSLCLLHEGWSYREAHSVHQDKTAFTSCFYITDTKYFHVYKASWDCSHVPLWGNGVSTFLESGQKDTPTFKHFPAFPSKKELKVEAYLRLRFPKTYLAETKIQRSLN